MAKKTCKLKGIIVKDEYNEEQYLLRKIIEPNPLFNIADWDLNSWLKDFEGKEVTIVISEV